MGHTYRRVLRPYVAPLYGVLNSPHKGCNVSIMPRMCSALLYCLGSRAVVSREVSGLNLPIKSRNIEIGGKPVYCIADLPTVPKSTGPTWIRPSDPTCPVIKMTDAAQNSLRLLLSRIQATPTTSLSMPPILSCLARADAMAEGDSVGIPGLVRRVISRPAGRSPNSLAFLPLGHRAAVSSCRWQEPTTNGQMTSRAPGSPPTPRNVFGCHWHASPLLHQRRLGPVTYRQDSECPLLPRELELS